MEFNLLCQKLIACQHKLENTNLLERLPALKIYNEKREDKGRKIIEIIKKWNQRQTWKPVSISTVLKIKFSC